LKGFFTFYNSQFDNKVFAISVRHGYFIEKSKLVLHTGQNNVLVICDPIDMLDNVGRRVTEITWQNLQNEFEQAVEVLNGTLSGQKS